ncbi:MAG: diaminopimelate epimerase [Mycobacteriales bacterium]
MVPDFGKYHAHGNDYLVVDPSRTGLDLGPATARLLCDRHHGLGADGLVLLPAAPVPSGRPVPVRLWNPDGSVCERSGNGLRMAALHLVEHGGQPAEVVLRTAAGDSLVQVLDPDVATVRIGLGRPSFAAADVPVLGVTGPAVQVPFQAAGRELTVTCLHNGGPHAVVPLDAVSPELAAELGPALATHPRFPDRTNVELVRVLDRGTVEVEAWERGAGYTSSSGSGAAAAVAAAAELGLVAGRVQVQMPGGAVDVTIAAGEIVLCGPVEQVAVGDFGPALRRRLGLPPGRDGRPPGVAVAGAAGRPVATGGGSR